MLVAASCATQVRNVSIDGAALAMPAKVTRLACPHRLGAVVDARQGEADGGQLGSNRLSVADAARMVHDSLSASGFDAADEGTGRRVDIELLRFYLLHNHLTKVPVVVYRVSVDAGEPFLVRAQPASMVWSGSQNEAIAGYRAGLADANARLVTRLNKGCSAPTGAGT